MRKSSCTVPGKDTADRERHQMRPGREQREIQGAEKECQSWPDPAIRGYRGGNEDVGVESEGIEKQDPGVPKPPPYIPPPPPDTEEDIFRQYQCGINFDKYDEILVDVKGNDVPPAILTFEEANLCDTLNKNISKAGYVKLTPVQKHSIPIILAGRDLMACAQTGSGKTAAFLLPILAQMMNEGITASQFKEFQEPEAIIVAPTRELINQIYLDARKFAYGTCVRPVVVYGGTQTGHSIRQILQGCNILCATPGRLMDIINREKIGLSKVRYVVLDEADRMLDMGFAPDIAKLMQNASMPSKEKRQTLMFSATYPEDIRRLALTYLKPDHLFVVVGQVGGACSDVEQTILEVKEYSKKDKLIEILQNIGNERTMVFVSTKKKADFMATLLCQERVRTTSIHGDREQREREKALQDFRSGNCPVIVATSVAARGLDIENVQHVINLDLPKEIEEYVHRIGRTGRCGNTGKAISFFDPDQDRGIASRLVRVLTDAHQVVPVWLEEIAFGGHGTSTYSTCENTARDEQNHAPEITECPDFTSEDVYPGGVDWTKVSTLGSQGCWADGPDSIPELFDFAQQPYPETEDYGDLIEWSLEDVDPGGVDWTEVVTSGSQGCWAVVPGPQPSDRGVTAALQSPKPDCDNHALTGLAAPAEALASRQSTAGLCPLLSVALALTPAVGSGNKVLPSSSDTPVLVRGSVILTSPSVVSAVVSGTKVHISGFVAPALESGINVLSIGPVSPATLTTLQRLRGLHGEGAVGTSPQWQFYFEGEAEV
ncbi:putative ATP-dependent RNA helicase DDX4 [Rhinophrynus dorsalis]